MPKGVEVATKIIKSNFQLVKITRNDSSKFIYNTLKNSNIINQKRLDVYAKSYEFENLVKIDDQIFKHPSYAKKVGETENTSIYLVVTITHSSNSIKINDQKVEKVIVSYYWKNGKLVPQYATNASLILVVDKNDSNIIIGIPTKQEIDRLGGLENAKQITNKLNQDWHKKSTYEYIDFLKKSVIHDIEKQDLTKPEEE